MPLDYKQLNAGLDEIKDSLEIVRDSLEAETHKDERGDIDLMDFKVYALRLIHSSLSSIDEAQSWLKMGEK